jgi:hypothetical protein
MKISKRWVTLLLALFIFIIYFVIPWIKNDTIYFYRSDESVYYYIERRADLSGTIPTTLNSYIGGIPNNNYPSLYLNLLNLLEIQNAHNNLHLESLALQLLMYVALLTSVLMIFKIAQLVFESDKTAIYSSILFVALPFISYRLFYAHATYYANFLGISLLLCFLYYLLKNRGDDKNASFLILSVIFYSSTLFTHQLVFYMATILLTIELTLRVVNKKYSFMKIYIIHIIFALIINAGYVSKTPIFSKILSIAGLSNNQQFGQEVAEKSSSSPLSTLLIPALMIITIIISFYILLKRRNKKGADLFIFFYLFLIFALLLQHIGIFLPASYRYDTFLIIPVPLLLSYFFSQKISNYVVITFTLFLLFILAKNSLRIVNNFTYSELTSANVGLNRLNCSNTVAYFRIAPWIPLVSKSSIYYSHSDIYNAHQDKLNNTIEMFSYKTPMENRINLIHQNHVNCILYEKNSLEQDGIRVKGWERWRYQDLYSASKETYEDKNLVVFKF